MGPRILLVFLNDHIEIIDLPKILILSGRQRVESSLHCCLLHLEATMLNPKQNKQINPGLL